MTPTLWVCAIGAVAANVWLLAMVASDGGWDGVWIWFLYLFGGPAILWLVGRLLFVDGPALVSRLVRYLKGATHVRN